MSDVRKEVNRPRRFGAHAGLLLIAALSLISCSSGGNSSQVTTANVLPATVNPKPDASPTPSARPVSVKLNYVLPTSSNVAGQSIGHASGNSYRKPEYVSAANTQLRVTVTPLGGSGTSFGPSACTGASCPITFTANPGPNTIDFFLTDGSSNVLSNFHVVSIIQPNAINTLSFTGNPVVHSVSVTLANSALNAGSAADNLVTIAAKDIDNNTIAGTGNYVDANGNPITLTVNASTTQAGGNGSVSLTGSTRITSPNQALTYAHYDGKALASAAISVSANATLPGGSNTATLTVKPFVTEYAAAGGPAGITVGPDGNLWFAEYNGNKIGKMTTSGVFTQYGCGACSGPYSIVTGPDGNLWYTEYGGGYVSKMTSSGTATRMVYVSGSALAIRVGPDGNIWYTSDFAQTVGRVTPTGTLQSFAAGLKARGMNFGPDGNVYYMEYNGTRMRKMRTDGSIIATYTLPSEGCCSDGLVIGPDGDLWFVNDGSDLVEKIDSSGTITGYNLQNSAFARDIVLGPDGNLWVTEINKDAIARVTPSGTVTEFGTSNGITAGAAPIGITAGPDGNIWFAESGTNSIGKLVI